MAIAVRSTRTEDGDDTSRVTIRRPSNLVDGDFMVMFCWSDEDGDPTKFSCTGWTTSATGAVTSGSPGGRTLTKIAAAEPREYTVRTPRRADLSIAIIAISAAATSATPVAVVATYGTGAASTSVVAPSIGSGATPAIGDLLLCSAAAVRNGSINYTPPAGMTEQTDVDGESDYLHTSVASLVLTGAGATGTKTFTASNTPADDYRTVSIAITAGVVQDEPLPAAFKAGQKLTVSDVNNNMPETVSADATTASQTVTTTQTDLAGATVTFTTPVDNTVVIARGMFDVTTNGTTDIFRGILMVDGVAETSEARYRRVGDPTMTQVWRVLLASAGSHTLKLRVQKTNSSNTVTCQSTGSGIIVLGRGISS